MARPDEAKRAAVLATLARYAEDNRPGDRALAREVWEDWGIKVSPPFVYFMRTGQRRGEVGTPPAFYEDEGEALNMPAGGALAAWAWLVGLVAVVALVLVLAWASRQRQQRAASDATLASAPDATSAAPGGLALA